MPSVPTREFGARTGLVAWVNGILSLAALLARRMIQGHRTYASVTFAGNLVSKTHLPVIQSLALCRMEHLDQQWDIRAAIQKSPVVIFSIH